MLISMILRPDLMISTIQFKEDIYIPFLPVLFEQPYLVFAFSHCKKHRVNIEIKCRKLINSVEF